MTTSASPLPRADPRDFAADLNHVARSLRTSLSTLLTSVGLDPHAPQAVAREWGVNRQLSWKVSKVIQSGDPFVALQHLPGPEGVAILLKKGEAAGVPAAAIEAARRAAAAVDQLIETHCGDRAAFDIMGSAASAAEPARQQQEALRRQFFLGASSIWGAQAKVNLVSWFVAPTPGSGGARIDAVSLKAWLGFRRLRENLSWVVSRHLGRHDDGTAVPMAAPEPLDPRSSWQVPLVRDFCSDPVPPIHVSEGGGGGPVTVSIAPGPVGNAGQVSCVFGKIHRGLPHVRGERDREARFMADLNLPAEVAILDLFLHESLVNHPTAARPVAALASLIEPRDVDPARNRLPLPEPMVELGPPSPTPLTLEVPRYGEMIDLVQARTGWPLSTFHGFRVRVAYPPLPAALRMTYPLPPPAG